MLPGFTNHLINPDFSFTDFGTTSRSTDGYVVPRWKIALTGAPTVTAIPSTLPADIGQPKWLRGKAGLTVNATALAAGQRVRLTQRIEAGERFSRQAARVTVVLYGPDGGKVRYGIGSTYRTVTTRGATAAVTATYTETVDDPTTEYLEAGIEPLTTGAYQIAFVQVDWPDDLTAPPSLELRSRQIERTLLDRYVYPLRRGMYVATASTTQMIPANFPTEMRIAPTLAYTAASLQIAELRAGTVSTVTSPAVTVLDAGVGGCRVRITGTLDTIPAATDGIFLTGGGIVLTADY